MMMPLVPDFQTPERLRSDPYISNNPFDYEPSTPVPVHRVSGDVKERILQNIENLCAPSFSATGFESSTTSRPAKMNFSDKPRFSAALQKMRNGSALNKLRAERDAELQQQQLPQRTTTPPPPVVTDQAQENETEASKRLLSWSLAGTEADKGPSTSPVSLGVPSPRRRKRSIARSA